jgi:hypothetical protein
MKIALVSLAALSLTAAAPAAAGSTAPDGQPAVASPSQASRSQEAPKICRYIDSTESRMKRQRLCYTSEQWKKFDEAQED